MNQMIPVPEALTATARPALAITGHFGIGDNLHQRAVMRALMPTYDVWLHTCHFNLYHDLVEQGLKLVLRPTGLHAQAKTVQRESREFRAAKFPSQPFGARQIRIGYPKEQVDKYGSILEAMFGCVGIPTPARPDFSLPIRRDWREQVRAKYLSTWNMGGKRLMVHRPVTIRREWDGRSRNPDPAAYDELYRSIRDQFFVASLADLAKGREWIDGPQQDADIKLHHGELAFEEMAALFAEADLVFANAGFAPVLAQAVGAPNIVVYGGRESFRTTQRAGAHLARTLPIDVINPCDCHTNKHGCDKSIDMPSALDRVATFAQEATQPRTLLFGTFYVENAERAELTDLWKQLHLTINERDCDFLAVDSQSPIAKFEGWHPHDGKRHHLMYFNFDDNIGHLSRPDVAGRRDGWGRAFCKGLEVACELGYEHVVHVEGDSLLRLPVADVIQQMKMNDVACASSYVRGMRKKEIEHNWIETGLMFFSTEYLRGAKFVARYDWAGSKYSTPERYILKQMLQKDLNENQLRIMPWQAVRADVDQVNEDNVAELDWITHQRAAVARKFVALALAPPAPVPVVAAGRKLNLGCGTNKMAGWENHDADVDITKPLPWPDGSASHIIIEHCVEHVPYKAAIEFMKEAHRVLAPGGVLRITVPSLQQIAACDEADYFRFTTKWQKLGANKRGAMHAIIYAHGHETAWNAQLMRDTLYFAGFDDVHQCQPGQSDDPVLQGVERHGKVIGDKFNRIESCTHEARRR